ncbi:hypothetical protein [Nonomuraea basaltis]|uniref:hypothetical protein n=1 Tax=Nonomuraea basaltis TaxID=2495887 RepID=UPI00110C6961|nr:hypothetical protein [Nonomuraea basaltis]TMR96947.1 hypothetical protein EJK15_20415 [Nonomuraea basaltis]
MNDTDREIQAVYGTRLVSAAWLSETADGLERALLGSLDRADRAAGTGGPDQPGAQFDVEFTGLTDLVRGAFGATARRLRDHAAGATLSERNYSHAEQANVESADRIRTPLEGI